MSKKTTSPVMIAMSYEVLMRKAYNCGRNFSKGADADIYRRLERAVIYKESGRYNKTITDLENDYIKAFEEVAYNIEKAINRILFNRSLSLSKEQRTELNECKISLDTRAMELMIKVIEKVNKIMKDIELPMG